MFRIDYSFYHYKYTIYKLYNLATRTQRTTESFAVGLSFSILFPTGKTPLKQDLSTQEQLQKMAFIMELFLKNCIRNENFNNVCFCCRILTNNQDCRSI